MNAIFSIKPKYVRRIFDGRKTSELRRVAPRQLYPGDKIVIWESSPKMRLAGTATVESVDIDVELPTLLHAHGDGLSRPEFYEYFKGCDVGVGIGLKNPREFYPYKPDLDTLRRELNLWPPQSFRYVSDGELALILDLFHSGASND